jgi:hypothetical protein
MSAARLLVTFLAGGLAGAALSSSAHAEEGPTGPYWPGTVADFSDGIPPRGTLSLRTSFFRYSGSNDVDALPIAGLTATNVRATYWGFALTAVLRPTWDLTSKLSWAASLTLPVMSVSVSANVQNVLGGVTARDSHLTNFGDTIVTPLIFIYTFTPELTANARLVLYAPTGRYQTDRLANTGKNFVTIQPLLGFTYFGSTNGIEATVYGGIDLNRKNESTMYGSGAQLHVDGTLALHLRVRTAMLGVGGSAYWYQQVTADSGMGATLGPSEARAGGVGPVVSYVSKLGPINFIVDLKWMRDFAVQHRLEGQLWLLKLVATYSDPGAAPRSAAALDFAPP